jgi:hypothetical protein
MRCKGQCKQRYCLVSDLLFEFPLTDSVHILIQYYYGQNEYDVLFRTTSVFEKKGSKVDQDVNY